MTGQNYVAYICCDFIMLKIFTFVTLNQHNDRETALLLTSLNIDFSALFVVDVPSVR